MDRSSAAHPKLVTPTSPPSVARGDHRDGAPSGGRARFPGHVFDPTTGELWAGDGEAERLRPQLAALLELLVRHPRELVKRGEIQEHLWADRVLDVDRSINFCIRQLRAILDDDAKRPRFIETLPRQGYRFIAPVRWASGLEERASEDGTSEDEQRSGSSAGDGAGGGDVATDGADEPRIVESFPTRGEASGGRAVEGTARPRRRHHFAAVAAGSILGGAVVIGGVMALLRGPTPETPTSELSNAHSAVTVSPPSPLETELRLGDLQMLEGRYETAAATLQAAVARHPDSVQAWTRLSEAYVQLARDQPDAFDDAEFALSRAESLAPDSAAVHVRWGDLLALRDRRWSEALAAFERAAATDPGLIEAHISLGFASAVLGRWQRSGEHLERALELDPLNRRTLVEAAMLRAAARDWPRTRALSLRLLELEHDSMTALSRLIEANRRLGLEAEAREAARTLAKLLELDGGEISFATEDDYRRLWRQIIDRRFDGPGHLMRAQQAVYLARIGARDQALDRLETVAAGRSWLLPLVLLEPAFEALSGDPRFAALQLEAERPWSGDGF